MGGHEGVVADDICVKVVFTAGDEGKSAAGAVSWIRQTARINQVDAVNFLVSRNVGIAK